MSAAVASPAQFQLGKPTRRYPFQKHSLDSSPTDAPQDSEFLERVDSSGAVSDTSIEERASSSDGKKLRKDKFAFVVGVAHFWICAYWLGSYPSTFYKLYTFEALILFPLRWKSFKKMKMHYYMFDFCYGANLLLLVFLWCFPRSNYLFKVLFAFNSGPLAWAIVLFKNSLVYHSLDEVTSLFMHWSPMLVSWSMRWYPDCSSVTCQDPPMTSLEKGGVKDMILWPMLPYLAWAALYYLKIFVVSSKKIRDRGYHTLYKYMTEDSNFRILRSVVFKFSPKWQPLVYMCIHLLLVWISLFTSVVWWKSFWAHTVWIAMATLISAWNVDLNPNKRIVVSTVPMATAASLAAMLSNSRSGSGSFLVRSPSTRGYFEPEVPDAICVSIVVLGASGDLAKKKTYPALFQLHSKGFLPPNVQIIGYARTAMSNEDLRKKIRDFLKGPDDKVEDFLKTMTYLSGQYDGDEGFMKLQQVLNDREVKYGAAPNGRLYYLALPPSVYPQVCTGLKKNCSVVTQKDNPKSFLRIVIEKPFGRDFDSSEELSEQLGRLFEEEQMYRIDHYLGKELTQNLMVMRFGNCFFECWWNRQYISNIQVTFKENFGVEGRGGYFDEFGIIRDVIQNHLLQLLTLVAMEKPISTQADDIRDEKLKVLRCIDPVEASDCVIGQYAGDRDHLGYLQDKTVPPNSKTPTFASCVLYVRNGRWDGVPIILKAGKALNERKSEIRIQLKEPPAALYTTENSRNEFVIRLQPSEAIYMKMLVKKPGLESDAEMSELDLSYDQRYKDANIPDAYERLILDVIRGDQQHFVRRDELAAAWKIFTPLLEKIDKGLITPETYFYGSRGPRAADELLARVGYERSSNYLWKKE